MNHLLVIRHIEVENANAIAGITWGFPAITNFLGFTHSLSRKLPKNWMLNLEECGVVCHKHQAFVYRESKWSEYNFALTRNPVTKKGETPPFVEEGRMHLTISLVIPCKEEVHEDLDREEVKNTIHDLAITQRLAGGTIKSIGQIELLDIPEEFSEKEIFEKKQLRKLLPGFALILRSNLLAEHTRQLTEQESNFEPLDAWLDFYTLKHAATNEINSDGTTKWNYISKPGNGWLVPIAVGYHGISKLYVDEKFPQARDNETPFRFTEQAYSIGEWIGPHRIKNLNQLFWGYHAEAESGWYLCKTPE